MLNKTLADKLATQALNEISESRIYKQGKIKSWQDNEAMYYGRKLSNDDGRANVALGQGQEFVHTLLSKIDNPLIFKFTKRKPSQLKRVDLINALRKADSDTDFWDLKDIVGKKQAIIYGRAIYSYYASSHEGYCPHLDNKDVYDFLIDPSVSGIDMETAMYMGDWGAIKTIKDLKDGVKEGYYHPKQVYEVIESGASYNQMNQEETNKRARSYDQKTIGQKELYNANKFRFWQWNTTYNGKRYYLLMDNSGRWIRAEKLDKIFETDLFPYWSWAAFPDLTEFWTPSYMDYARQIFMAQEVTINQMLDNAEAINQPQKIVRVNDIEDPSKIYKYKRGQVIPVKANVDIDKTVKFVEVPKIDTPIQVFNILQAIQDRASGVTAGSAGVADEEGKVGIYEGNQANAADRFGLLNKSYSFGYKKFAKLYEAGVKEHLIKKVAVEILGPNGVEVKEISRKDIYKRGDEFGLMVEASDAERINNARNQEGKTVFLASQVGNPMVNQKKAFEMRAKISGLNEEEIRELLDVNSYGNEELMSEADRDIEALLNGENIELNDAANNAYKQRMVSYLQDHKEDITDKQFFLISAYIDALDPTIMRNEARALNTAMVESLKQPLPPLDPKQANQLTEQPYEVPTNQQI